LTMILRVTALGLFVFAPNLLSAQVSSVAATPARVISSQDPGGEILILDGQGQPLVQPGAAPVQAAGAAKKPSARAAKLKTLEYDRRPSSILKAWANPPKPPKEEAKPAEAVPAPAPVPADAKPLDPEAQKKKDE